MKQIRNRILLLLLGLLALPTFCPLTKVGGVGWGCFAQTNTDRLSLGVGALYEKGMDATLAWEHETRYHNAWEVFVNGYVKWTECASCGHVCPESFWKNYRTWGVGIAYKPCVYRGFNSNGNLRIGASGGSNTSAFIGGLHVGYEHSYTLYRGWQLYWQAKCDLIVPKRNDLFRLGVVIGVKLPVRNK